LKQFSNILNVFFKILHLNPPQKKVKKSTPVKVNLTGQSRSRQAKKKIFPKVSRVFQKKKERNYHFALAPIYIYVGGLITHTHTGRGGGKEERERRGERKEERERERERRWKKRKLRL